MFCVDVVFKSAEGFADNSQSIAVGAKCYQLLRLEELNLSSIAKRDESGGDDDQTNQDLWLISGGMDFGFRNLFGI